MVDFRITWTLLRCKKELRFPTTSVSVGIWKELESNQRQNARESESNQNQNQRYEALWASPGIKPIKALPGYEYCMTFTASHKKTE